MSLTKELKSLFCFAAVLGVFLLIGIGVISWTKNSKGELALAVDNSSRPGYSVSGDFEQDSDRFSRDFSSVFSQSPTKRTLNFSFSLERTK